MTFSRRRLLIFLALWCGLLFAAVIVSVFLHESGHGFGATIDGIHVSTGFNRVGNPGMNPGDPNFRTGTPNGVWSGLLGPMMTWLIAIVSTIWLYRFQQPTRGAFIIGAVALVNGYIRTLPLLIFVGRGLRGQLWLEDEVGWGIWYVGHFLRPDLGSQDIFTLATAQPALLLSMPAVWIPPLVSIAISVACLIPAYVRVFKLWGEPLGHWAIRALFGALPPVIYVASVPILNALDRVIRINW